MKDTLMLQSMGILKIENIWFVVWWFAVKVISVAGFTWDRETEIYFTDNVIDKIFENVKYFIENVFKYK